LRVDQAFIDSAGKIFEKVEKGIDFGGGSNAGNLK
jgi:hypothetical protein